MKFKQGDRVVTVDGRSGKILRQYDHSGNYEVMTEDNWMGSYKESELKTALQNETKAETGKKFDDDKPPMELLSHRALVEIAKVFGMGAKKYGKYNYRNGIAWTRIIGAAYRHLGQFNAGEDLDSESGVSHIAHLGCCVVMLLDYIAEHPKLDDRYKPEKK